MEKVYSAGIITYRIHKKKREYLILHYIDGHWDFPKGKIEQTETAQEAALRELYEETGLEAQIHGKLSQSLIYKFDDHDKKTKEKEVYFFVGHARSETITLSDEHQNYQWLSFRQALEKLTYINAKELLKTAHELLEQLEKND